MKMDPKGRRHESSCEAVSNLPLSIELRQEIGRAQRNVFQ